MNPAQRSLRSRLGGLATAARHDSTLQTAAARAAFLSKFDAQVDPDGVLPIAERQRRAEAARRLHMAQLAYKSSRARTKPVRSQTRSGE